MFRVDLRTNSDYFPIVIGFRKQECVYCAVRTGYFKRNISKYIEVDINRYTWMANIRAIEYDVKF